MFIKLTAAGDVTLEDRDNFRAFKLVVDGRRGALDDVRDALAGTAELVDADTAWVSEQALRPGPRSRDAALAAGALGDDREGAAARLDDARKAIKAHVEWTG